MELSGWTTIVTEQMAKCYALASEEEYRGSFHGPVYKWAKRYLSTM